MLSALGSAMGVWRQGNLGIERRYDLEYGSQRVTSPDSMVRRHVGGGRSGSLAKYIKGEQDMRVRSEVRGTRSMMSIKLVALVAVFGIVVAACSGEEADETPEPSEEEGETAEEDANEDAVEEEQEEEAAPSDDLEALYEAALEEGELVTYYATSENVYTGIIEQFQERYPGIDVQSVRLNSSAISQRFGAERDSGAPTADLIQHGAVGFHLTSLEEGWVVPAGELPLPEEFPDEFISPQLGPILGHPLPAILYNTDLVSEDEIPTTWEDLTDPRWRGELLMADLEEQDWHVGVYGTVIDEFGEEWVEAFMANEPRVVSGGVAPITELIAAGEASVAPIGFIPLAKGVMASGAPLDYTIPDPQTSTPAIAAVNSEAENPNAARLFYHYQHTEEGMQPRLDFGGAHQPFQTDVDYEWVDDDLRWVSDPDYVEYVTGLFGQ